MTALKLLGAFVVLWAMLGIGMVPLVETLGFGPYIELFNGATWPELFTKDGSERHRDFAFYAALSLRTLINLGVVLSAGAALLVLLGTGSLQRLLMRTFDSVLHNRDVELAGYVLEVLERNNVVVGGEVEDKVYKAVEDYARSTAGKSNVREAREAAAVAPD